MEPWSRVDRVGSESGGDTLVFHEQLPDRAGMFRAVHNNACLIRLHWPQISLFSRDCLTEGRRISPPANTVTILAKKAQQPTSYQQTTTSELNPRLTY